MYRVRGLRQDLPYLRGSGRQRNNCTEDEKIGLAEKPVINVEHCSACENCVAVCPAYALAMADEKLPLTMNRAVLAQPNKCVSCGWCKDNCLFDAIIMGVAS